MGAGVNRIALLARAVEALRVLAVLDAWPFVGERAEAVRAALGGMGGVDAGAVDRLAEYAERWAALPATLQAFYAVQVQAEPCADLALRRVLCGDATPLPGWRYGVLKRRWEECYGMEPAIELVPVSPTLRRRSHP